MAGHCQVQVRPVVHVAVEIDVAHAHAMLKCVHQFFGCLPFELPMFSGSKFLDEVNLIVKDPGIGRALPVLVQHNPATVPTSKNFSAITHGKVAIDLYPGLFRNPQFNIETLRPWRELSIYFHVDFGNDPIQTLGPNIERREELAPQKTGKSIFVICQG